MAIQWHWFLWSPRHDKFVYNSPSLTSPVQGVSHNSRHTTEYAYAAYHKTAWKCWVRVHGMMAMQQLNILPRKNKGKRRDYSNQRMILDEEKPLVLFSLSFFGLGFIKHKSICQLCCKFQTDQFYCSPKLQTPVTLCSGDLWSVPVVRLAHSTDLRFLHVLRQNSLRLF